jgi:hypothetical protein
VGRATAGSFPRPRRPVAALLFVARREAPNDFCNSRPSGPGAFRLRIADGHGSATINKPLTRAALTLCLRGKPEISGMDGVAAAFCPPACPESEEAQGPASNGRPFPYLLMLIAVLARSSRFAVGKSSAEQQFRGSARLGLATPARSSSRRSLARCRGCQSPKLDFNMRPRRTARRSVGNAPP